MTTPEPDDDLDLATLIDGAVTLAEHLDTLMLQDTLSGLDWTDALHRLHRLREATAILGRIDATLVRHIYLTGEHGKTLIDGIGEVTVARSRDRRKWDARGVARAVIDQQMTERAGEAPDPWDVAEWLLEVYGVGYCRVTPLRALGLEPAAFCEDTPGKPTVSL